MRTEKNRIQKMPRVQTRKHAPKCAQEKDWGSIDVLRASIAVPDDPAPGRSFTVAEYAARYKLPYQTASEQLRKLAAAGRLKTGMKGAPVGNRVAAVRCYWVA